MNALSNALSNAMPNAVSTGRVNPLAAGPDTDNGERPLLRIVIVGHVDHGKSTLIGRLLHETDSLPDGKLQSLQAVSARRGMAFEWSFLLDALQTERDQGITIDTSQVRFRTPSRDVVLIDAPGHTEFLRNMITGAAQADVALLLVDAAEGIQDQTRRHGYMLHLLGVRQIAVVINKMDRVDFDPDRFRAIESEISKHLTSLGMIPAAVIPISARNGDGVARRTPAIDWYKGPTVLEALDTFSTARPAVAQALRLPIQAVYKFDDRRIIAGRIETGRVSVGDEIVFMPSGKTAHVRTIESWPDTDPARAPKHAASGQSVGITLDRELFVERGDLISTTAVRPKAVRRVRARVFWLSEQPLAVGGFVNVRIGTAESRGTIAAIDKAIDPGHLAATSTSVIGQNHVGEIEIALSKTIAADPYQVNPRTGRIVLDIDGRIAGGGLVISVVDAREAQRPAPPSNIVPVKSGVSAEERQSRFGHTGAVVWLTGLPASGKSTLARAFERRLFEHGAAAVLLDGDTLRTGLNSDLGFSPEDRAENIRRVAEVASHLAHSGLIAIVAVVSPAAADRARARQIAGDHFHEVHVAAPLDVCESRDPKGHYRKARAGEIPTFTGVNAGYEAPQNADLVIDTSKGPVDAGVRELEQLLINSGVLSVSDRSAEFVI